MNNQVTVSETDARMIPAGYLYKLIKPRTDFIRAPNVSDIYSVGDCGAEFSPNFCDLTPYFKHNGFGFFNAPEINLLHATQLATT